MESDFVKYHQNLSVEFMAIQDQIRHLIGDSHWLTDGEHKEAILRKVLRNRLSDTVRVGRGFFCDDSGPSNQSDIMITDTGSPTLFRDGDLVIVTPDCVKAIIEVKTKITTRSMLEGILGKLSENITRVRRYNPDAWAGLFIYDGLDTHYKRTNARVLNKGKTLLDVLCKSSHGSEKRAVNCVAWGPNLFSRYWSGKMPQMGTPRWSVYYFGGEHERLSPSYFISNLVMDIASGDDHDMRFAWYPIQTGLGKEDYLIDQRNLVTKHGK